MIGIDIDIRPHNKKAIINYPLGKKIIMFEGSSVNDKIIEKVKKITKNKRVLVCLDSNHFHNHVLAELHAYALLVSAGSYCIVGDTGIEDFPRRTILNHPWGKGNNPKIAVWGFLR